ncbi:MAG: tRNA (cytidine(34)-2'-O)-methyltransferase [Elusimicrobiota bacterium]
MNVVLIEPEIHFNTGNIGRTCVGAGAELHLVGRLGFSLDCAQIRRSGLDYWPKLRLRRHEDFASFLASMTEADPPLYFFSAEASKTYWEADFHPGSYLVFGKESVGLAAEIREKYRDRTYRIPHSGRIRSLNLGTAAAVVLYEALRQTGRVGASGGG